MAWSAPIYTKSEVDRAGNVLVGRKENEHITYNYLDIINNWRSSHSFPLNTFQINLRRQGKRIDNDCLVAQRIKRLSSISHRLGRFKGLRLSQMQDIGGCRIVLRDIESVRAIVDAYKKSGIKHSLVQTDDYLDSPQSSGYRGVHLIYKYRSDRTDTFNNLKIEIQVRSQYQHAWATAVETVGTFLSQSLKSSIGESDWLRFFALMGTAIAFEEGTSPVPNTFFDTNDLRKELNTIADRLDVVNRLEIYGETLQYFERVQDGHYYILELDPVEKKILVRAFQKNELERAQRAYLEVEKNTESTASDAVLVSVDSMSALQRAYPNYFLDTRVFIGLVRDALKGDPLEINSDIAG